VEMKAPRLTPAPNGKVGPASSREVIVLGNVARQRRDRRRIARKGSQASRRYQDAPLVIEAGYFTGNVDIHSRRGSPAGGRGRPGLPLAAGYGHGTPVLLPLPVPVRPWRLALAKKIKRLLGRLESPQQQRYDKF